MSERINEAIAKITNEMMAIGTRNARKIEEYLTSRCTCEGVAEKLLEESKTLKECIATCKERARSQAEHGGAMIEDEEVFEWVEEYYGITDIEVTNLELNEAANDTPAAKVDLLSLF